MLPQAFTGDDACYLCMLATEIKKRNLTGTQWRILFSWPRSIFPFRLSWLANRVLVPTWPTHLGRLLHPPSISPFCRLLKCQALADYTEVGRAGGVALDFGGLVVLSSVGPGHSRGTKCRPPRRDIRLAQ